MRTYRQLEIELARAWARVKELQQEGSVLAERTGSRDFARLLHMAPIPIWIAHDPQCHVVTGNRAASELSGFDSETNVSQTPPAGQEVPRVRHLCDGRELRPEELPLQYAVAHGEELRDVELDLVLPDGTVKHVLGNAAPLFDAQGRIRGGMTAYLDLTPHKQSEEALWASEQRYRRLFEDASLGIFQSTPRGQIIQVNPAYARMFGYDSPEQVKTEMTDIAERIYVHPQRRAEVVRMIMESQGPVVVENHYKRRDGSTFIGRLHAWVVYDEGQFTRLEGFVEDITERKKAEDALQALNETLEQRVAERTALAERRSAQLRDLALQLIRAEEKERRRVANILHDHFQQLLVAAKFRVGLLRRHPERSRAEILETIEDALAEAIRVSRSLTVELCPPILYDVGLSQALQWLARWMQDRQGLQVNVSGELPAGPIAQDLQVMLFHAVRELLFNVVKHASVSSASLEMASRDGGLCIAVTDEGTGFDVSGGGSDGQGSAGYGLVSIRERLEHLGGQLRIDTAPGRGTRVSLLVPMLPPGRGEQA